MAATGRCRGGYPRVKHGKPSIKLSCSQDARLQGVRTHSRPTPGTRWPGVYTHSPCTPQLPQAARGWALKAPGASLSARDPENLRVPREGDRAPGRADSTTAQHGVVYLAHHTGVRPLPRTPPGTHRRESGDVARVVLSWTGSQHPAPGPPGGTRKESGSTRHCLQVTGHTPHTTHLQAWKGDMMRPRSSSQVARTPGIRFRAASTARQMPKPSRQPPGDPGMGTGADISFTGSSHPNLTE